VDEKRFTLLYQAVRDLIRLAFTDFS